ncbi:MAG: gamma-glutamyltransferase [Chloroflexota bacterium]
MRRLGERGMVASPHYLATQAGVHILRSGGNAIDAALAVNSVLAVVTPYLCGLGGDLFAMVYDAKSKSLTGLNASGWAPLEATLERVRELAGGTMPERGPLSVTVPGCAAGWGALHHRFGKLPLDQILADALYYARSGFPAGTIFGRAMERSAAFFQQGTPAAETFLPGERPPAEGELLVQPRLARTLATISKEGPEAFYRGAIAEEVVRSVRALGGLLSLSDLQEYQPEWVEPLSIDYRDVQVFELPPNSQGVIALLALTILRQLPAERLREADADYVHLLAECTRLAYADRDAYVTDPDHMRITPEDLLSAEYGKQRAALVGDRVTARTKPGEPGGTAYMCAADADRNLVSLIESNYIGVGSGVMAGETGVMLQNRGAWFSLHRHHANAIAPRKRTMHTLMPAMAFRRERPWLVFGTMGGSTQPQIHIQLLTRLVDQGMPLDEAIAAARFDAAAGSDEAGKPVIQLEPGIGEGVAAELAGRGHAVRELESRTIGHAQAIEILPEGTYLGVADPRTESLALGY